MELKDYQRYTQVRSGGCAPITNVSAVGGSSPAFVGVQYNQIKLIPNGTGDYTLKETITLPAWASLIDQDSNPVVADDTFTQSLTLVGEPLARGTASYGFTLDNDCSSYAFSSSEDIVIYDGQGSLSQYLDGVGAPTTPPIDISLYDSGWVLTGELTLPYGDVDHLQTSLPTFTGIHADYFSVAYNPAAGFNTALMTFDPTTPIGTYSITVVVRLSVNDGSANQDKTIYTTFTFQAIKS